MRINRQKMLSMNFSIFLSLVLLICAISPGSLFAQQKSNSPLPVLRAKFEKKVASIVEESDAVIGLAIKDLTTGEELVHNGNMQFTQASVIKLEILVELFRQAKEGRFSLDDVVALEESNIVGGSGILKRLTAGKVSMTIRDIAVLMILASDNTATNMIIDMLGMDNVNGTMKKLGLEKTKLQRKMMDGAASAADRENLSTPIETLRLLEMLHKGEILDQKSCDEILEILSIPKSGSIRTKLPSGVKVAHKTGFVGGVLNDTGIVYLKNRPFVVVAFVNWHTDSGEARDAISQVSLAAYQYFDRLGNSNSYGNKR